MRKGATELEEFTPKRRGERPLIIRRAIASQHIAADLCFGPQEIRFAHRIHLEIREELTFVQSPYSRRVVYRRKVALGRGLELSGLLLAVSYEAACGLFLV